MAAPKRSLYQREYDLARTSKLYLQGYTQTEIAEELGVSQAQVSYDVKILKKRLLAAQVESMDERAAIQLAKHRHFEREAWDSLTRSKTPFFDPAVMSEVLPPGDPKWGVNIQNSLNQQDKILGIVVNKIAPTSVDGKESYKSEAEDVRTKLLAAMALPDEINPIADSVSAPIDNSEEDAHADGDDE